MIKKCFECGKKTEDFTLRSGKSFCSSNCIKSYGKNKSKKSGVCEFC